VTEITVREFGSCYLSVVSQHRLGRPVMTPLRTAALVVLFTLAALSAVGTCVESYHLGGGLWAVRAGHQFAFEGDSSPVLNGRVMFMRR
jgi:hypothetical protein